MKKVKKGNYGYLKYEKKKRLLVTLVLFLIPIVIYVSGYLYLKTTSSILTVVAIVGCLPACKSLVGLIMMMMQKPMPEEKYLEAKKAHGNLIGGYDLAVTAYEHTSPVNAFVVCGNHLVCYTPDEKTDCAYLERHIEKILAINNLSTVQVKVMKDFRQYLQRVSVLCEKQEHYREGIAFTPDERYPKLSREEVIYHTLLAISL